MYLSAERLALANTAIQRTFEQTCTAWQTIPHWDTGDPAQTLVADGNMSTPGFENVVSVTRDVDIAVAEALSPTPDAMLARVVAGTVATAQLVDDAVFPALRTSTTSVVNVANANPPVILDGLIDARVSVESGGFRAASCLVTDTIGIKALNQLVPSGIPFRESSLEAANINSVHRVAKLEEPAANVRGILLGRRQRIAHGGAADASPGEEPVDLAVSVAPGLEVVGADGPNNKIKLRVRVSYALRVKEASGVVLLVTP
jgi:hypothetical protein